MRASKRDIVDDEDKIMFVLSFMKQGLPAQFARNFNEDAENKRGGSFGTWADFKIKLQATFENKNRRKEALAKLKALKQGSQNAEAFFQQFELTRREAQVDDENILIDLVEHAIPKDIRAQIYRRGGALPATYDLWKEKAIELDAMERRLKSFDDTPHTWRSATPRPLPTPPKQYAPAQSSAQPAPAWKPSGTTYGGMGKPMDLDTARRLNVCVKCGQSGHIGKFCPNRRGQQQVRQQEWQQPPQQQQQQGTSFDVRNLSYDEMKKFHDTWIEAESGRQKQIEAKKAYMAKDFH